MRKIKVCHLSSAHPDKDVRIFYKECFSLAKAGFDVSLILTNVSERVEGGVHVFGVHYSSTSRLNRMRKTVKLVLEKAIEINADIYHIHDPELLQIVSKLKQRNKKVIYDVHEDLPRQILSKPYLKKIISKPLSFVVEIFENNNARKVDAIVAATPFIRDRFVKINPNSIDVNNYPKLEELSIEGNYSEKTSNEICYVGGITRVRGVKEVVEALPKTSVKLLLAGKFNEQSLASEVQSLVGWKQVEELGYLDREGIKNTLKRAKIGIVTLHPIINYLDSLPVKMFEYMAAGIPIIASDFPFWKTIIEEGKCGLCVNPLDSDEIANAINILLNNPQVAAEMGERGKQLVQEKYNWKQEEIKLIELYKKLSVL